MVATTEIATEIVKRDYAQQLDALQKEADFLPELARLWPALSDFERMDLTTDWEHLMFDYFEQIEEDQATLTPEEARAFESIVAELRRHRDILARLGYYVPPSVTE